MHLKVYILQPLNLIFSQAMLKIVVNQMLIVTNVPRYDDSSLAVIRHVQSIVPIVRPRPNIRSHSVLFYHQLKVYTSELYLFMS